MKPAGRSVDVAAALVLPLATWLFLAFVGILVRYGWEGAYRLTDMAVAQALVVAVVYGTLVPALRRAARSRAVDRLKIALAAGAVRFVVTLLLAALVAWRGHVQIRGFLIWAAVTYVVMIKVETLILCRWMGRCEQE